jgi:16S rRNA (uracil1498-N3)-methyltransferase
LGDNIRMLPRIYHAGALNEGTEITISGGAVDHIGQTLRLRPQASLILFNGDDEDHIGRIISISRQEMTIAVGAGREAHTESPFAVMLLQGICRNHRMDMLIQKSTELGVHEIQPIICQRSIVKIGPERVDKRLGHWRGVAVSACQQSGRTRIPNIHAPENLFAAIETLDHEARLLLDPQGTDTLETAIGSSVSAALLIGPEGGLTDLETNSAVSAGFKRVRLGPRILRTETAPIAALSIIQYLMGDLASQIGDSG